jgi:hypothetical protein
MPNSLRIDTSVQDTLRKLSSELAAKFLADDPQWSISGLASRAWKIKHPDLPIVRSQDGTETDTLLQLHIRPPDSENKNWLVIAQNKVTGPQSHASPRALILASEDQPPNQTWDLGAIAQSAVNFFRKQKNNLRDQTQALMPEMENLSQSQPPAAESQPATGMPTASRRLRLAKRILDSGNT